MKNGYWIEEIGPGFDFKYEVTDGNYSEKTYNLDAALELCKDLNKNGRELPADRAIRIYAERVANE